MVKCSVIHRLLQLSVIECVFLVLGLMSIVHLFTFYGKYNYAHITLEQIPNVLHKETVPNLDKKKTNCRYDQILGNKEVLNSWDVPKSFDDFDPAGIVNGSYTPPCNPLFSVAILVTYRNRQKQLDIFLPYMHNFLRKQNIHYKVFLIEQRDEGPWNKGSLYNVGVRRAAAERFPCVVLHDVDLLPLAPAHLYACSAAPRHLSAAVDKFRYVLPYDALVGGVLALRSDHYIAADGFSNRYRGWGGEDDDFVERLRDHGFAVVRFPPAMSRYTMLVHRPEPKNPERLRLLAERAADGYSATRPRALHVAPHRLFTLLAVHL